MERDRVLIELTGVFPFNIDLVVVLNRQFCGSAADSICEAGIWCINIP
jgi:hypothetical protein